MKKKLALVVLIACMSVLFMADDCDDKPSADKKMQAQQEASQQQAMGDSPAEVTA
jgi:hypothetical protein